ncbi:hypothetical protein NDU88_006882 [Pleurodeles waltl]|uniref:Uncharacterized protein n=1 Tax=Pleurodeles waltl TaxID=8319 RepID=A0AAV7N2C5_PLEWA|nr:hypothetical protein NDU88_006882 [Pleurodeles waltl]
MVRMAVPDRQKPRREWPRGVGVWKAEGKILLQAKEAVAGKKTPPMGVTCREKLVRDSAIQLKQRRGKDTEEMLPHAKQYEALAARVYNGKKRPLEDA